MELLATEYYRQVLTSFGLVIEDDRVLTLTESGVEPVMCAGKQLVLPTQKMLSNTNWDKMIAFHPLCENIVRGPSEVIRLLSTVANVEANIRLADLIGNLVKLASDTTKHEKMLPEQYQVLRILADADKKFLSFMFDEKKGVMAQLNLGDMASTFSLIQFKLRRSTTLAGEEYKRACITSFPAIPKEGSSKVFGVPGRVKDVKMFADLMNFIFPDNDDVVTYSYGTGRKVAPYLGALLGAWSKVAERINKIVDTFAGTFPEFATSRVSLEMNSQKYLEALTEMRDSLPSLKGNEGVVSKGGTEEAAEIKLADPEPAPSIPRNHPAVAATAPAPQPADLPWETSPSQQEAAPVAQVSTTHQSGDTVSVAQALAATRPQYQMPVQPAPVLMPQAPAAAPGSLAEMIRNRSALNGLQLGLGMQPVASFGVSPYDVDYKAPQSPQQQPAATAPLRPSW